MPKVSVIVPNYNHAPFLRQRIDSVLAQSFGDYELLLLDDASTDESRNILAEYAELPNASLCVNTQNSGSPFRQWNKGAELARGEYLWFAESDDFAAPGLLGRLVSVLDAHPEVGLAYCQSDVVDEAGERLYSNLNWTNDLDPERWQRDFINGGKDECARFMVVKNTVPNASAVVVRRSAFDAAGGAADDFRLCGDWMTWVRMLLVSDVAFVADTLNRFREHASAVRASSKRSEAAIIERYKVVEFVCRSVPVDAAHVRTAADWLFGYWHRDAFVRAADYGLFGLVRLYWAGRRVDRALLKRIAREVALRVRWRLKARR